MQIQQFRLPNPPARISGGLPVEAPGESAPAPKPKIRRSKPKNGRHHKKYNRELRLYAISMIKDGRGYAAAAERVGCSPSTIKLWEAEFRAETGLVPAVTRPRKHTLAQKEDCVRRRLAGEHLDELAAATGIPYTTIVTWVKERELRILAEKVRAGGAAPTKPPKPPIAPPSPAPRHEPASPSLSECLRGIARHLFGI